MTGPIGRGKPPPLPATDKLVGEHFDGKFNLVRRLGAEATSTVYEAEHLDLGKRVAIKALPESVAKDEASRTRFVSEARALATIGHPNVGDIYDYGVTSRGTPYITMELVRGETLAGLVARRGALPPVYACELIVQVLAGLGAAHTRGIVHRALKPANVIVTYPEPDSPLVKIFDFGLAAAGPIGRDGADGPAGALVYLAPEQILSRPIDARTDLYAVGVLLYEMLAGVPPFSGAVADVARQIATGKWRPLANVNPAVPRLLTTTVATAMSTDPADRLPTAHAFSLQLSPYLSRPPPYSVPGGQLPADALLQKTALGGPAAIHVKPEGPRRTLSRDFPAVDLAKINGKPRGDVISDSILRSPVFPKAPNAPKIQLFTGIRETEEWPDVSRAPSDEPPRPEPTSSDAGDVEPHVSVGATADDGPRTDRDEPIAKGDSPGPAAKFGIDGLLGRIQDLGRRGRPR